MDHQHQGDNQIQIPIAEVGLCMYAHTLTNKELQKDYSSSGDRLLLSPLSYGTLYLIRDLSQASSACTMGNKREVKALSPKDCA